MGKAAVAGKEGNGWNRPSHERSDPAGHRGNDDGMPAHGDRTQHGKPQAVRARDPQPDAREGQAGLPGVAERLVVPAKPGNAGGGKEPDFWRVTGRDQQSGDWLCLSTPLRTRRSRKELYLPAKMAMLAVSRPLRDRAIVCWREKPVGEPCAGNSHARFDEREVETEHGAASEAPADERAGHR